MVLAVVFLVGSCAAQTEKAQASGAPAAKKESAAKFRASAIQILETQSKDVNLPAQFAMALYENLIEQVQKTGKFQHVYRDGDSGAKNVSDLVTLSSTVWGFKEGSARARQVTTVAGATSIKVHIRIANPQGETLVDRDVEGKVRFFGENLRATYNFAKAVAGAIQESF